jgi:hypothetical protein
MTETFPELTVSLTRAATTTPAQFWRTWSGGLDILLAKDTTKLFGDRKGFLLGAVRLTPEVWKEVSPKTHNAIWKYLRTLTLEAAMDTAMEGIDTETMQKLVDILTAERLESDPVGATSEMFEESMKHLNPLLEKLKGLMASGLGGEGEGEGAGAGASDFKMPEIPEHLRKGRIAKLAEDMAKQFDPADFGIDPALLKGDDVEEILKRLADMYQRDPTMLIAGAKNVAEKIKKQILSGSLNREELIAEAEEYMKLFKEHPMFKDAMDKLTGMVGPGGLAEMFRTSDSGTPSERRRIVQERLRKKMAARQKYIEPHR